MQEGKCKTAHSEGAASSYRVGRGPGRRLYHTWTFQRERQSKAGCGGVGELGEEGREGEEEFPTRRGTWL